MAKVNTRALALPIKIEPNAPTQVGHAINNPVVAPIPPNPLSPKLYDILQSSCGQIEALLRLICEKLELEYEKKTFPSYYETLNQTGILQRQKVASVIVNEGYEPFQLIQDEKTPEWWKAYNDTKHNLPEGYRQGNLENTIVALSGVFSLHCMAIYVNTAGKDILQNSNWNEDDSFSLRFLQAQPQAQYIDEDPRPRSELFYCMSYFRPLHGL